jgi:hypothetical protein
MRPGANKHLDNAGEGSATGMPLRLRADEGTEAPSPVPYVSQGIDHGMVVEEEIVWDEVSPVSIRAEWGGMRAIISETDDAMFVQLIGPRLQDNAAKLALEKLMRQAFEENARKVDTHPKEID